MGYDRIVYIRYHFSCGLDRKDACWLSFTPPLTGFVLTIFPNILKDILYLIMEVKFELSTALRFRLLVGPGLWSLGARLVSKILGGDPSLRYVGSLNDSQFQELGKFASDAVYKFWDQSDSSPPQQRPRDDSTGPVTPDLQILGYHNGSPFWPALISDRIQPDTPEHEALLKMKEKFEKMFPPTTASETSARTTWPGSWPMWLHRGLRGGSPWMSTGWSSLKQWRTSISRSRGWVCLNDRFTLSFESPCWCQGVSPSNLSHLIFLPIILVIFASTAFQVFAPCPGRLGASIGKAKRPIIAIASEPLSVAWSRWLRYHSWTGRAFWLWHRIIWSGGGPSCRHDFDTFFRFDWVLSSSSNVLVGSYKWGRSQNWTTSSKFLKEACRINQKLKSLEQHVVEDVGSLDLATQCLWTGDAQLETNGLVFRLQSDMAIISPLEEDVPSVSVPALPCYWAGAGQYADWEPPSESTFPPGPL